LECVKSRCHAFDDAFKVVRVTASDRTERLVAMGATDLRVARWVPLAGPVNMPLTIRRTATIASVRSVYCLALVAFALVSCSSGSAAPSQWSGLSPEPTFDLSGLALFAYGGSNGSSSTSTLQTSEVDIHVINESVVSAVTIDSVRLVPPRWIRLAGLALGNGPARFSSPIGDTLRLSAPETIGPGAEVTLRASMSVTSHCPPQAHAGSPITVGYSRGSVSGTARLIPAGVANPQGWLVAIACVGG
jgi:hypothetical protein